MNVDADVIQADWLRIVSRMRISAAMHPEKGDEEVRVAAERTHLAALRRIQLPAGTQRS